MTVACEEAVELMFEADVSELEGRGATPLAVHLRTCPRCLERAMKLLEGLGALSRSLDGAAARVSPEADPGMARTRARLAPSVRWKVILPLAAAAVATITLLTKTPDGWRPVVSEEPPLWAPTEASVAGPTPLVRSDLHESIAILPTSNPDITVVWFMD